MERRIPNSWGMAQVRHANQLMRSSNIAAAFVFVLLVNAVTLCAQSNPGNYVFFGRDREKIQTAAYLLKPYFTGAQITYPWRLLEPRQDQYDFASIESDLEWLNKHGKKLFVQLQDVSFDESIVNVPDYLRTDFYGQGVNRQYSFANDNDDKAVPAGWVARRWDSRVASRYSKLLSALGARFDGRIAGLNMPETAVDFGSTGKYYPPGFSPSSYRDAIKLYMRSAKKAFSKSIVIQYANFMPGEWLPWDDKGYLRSIYEYGKEIAVGLGGPDLKVYKKAQMNHSYTLLPGLSGIVPTGIAIQYGNYEELNPKTGKTVTIDEIYRFGRDLIKVSYLFWSIQEPYFSRDLIPYLDRNIK
jgi:hypothetical protein